MPCSELFEFIEKNPVASGSIGQIHRARLSEKGAALTGFEAGQTVAVKVRHPGVADIILRDFATMVAVARWLGKLEAASHLRLEDTLKQFAAPLKEQVDLAREAANLQRFNFNFRNAPSVQFPVPLYPLVSSEVLVETYEEGDHITRYISGDASGDSSKGIKEKLSDIGAGTMLQVRCVWACGCAGMLAVGTGGGLANAQHPPYPTLRVLERTHLRGTDFMMHMLVRTSACGVYVCILLL